MLLCLIFALKKKINLLQKLALVGVISVVFNFTVIVIISMTGFTRPDDHLHYRGVFHVDGSKISWAISSSWRSMSILAQGLASIVFCYVNHQLLFPLSNSLKRPSLLRFKKIILRLHAVELIIYSILGIMAYLLLLEHIKVHEIGALVITSIPIIPVKIGKFLMVLALFFAIPINAFPARQSILEACKLENSNKNHVIVTLSLLMSSCAIAIAFQKVNSYFGLLGGTAGVLMSAGIPSICYYRLADKISKLDVLFLIIVAFTSVVAGVGAFLSVFNPV